MAIQYILIVFLMMAAPSQKPNNLAQSSPLITFDSAVPEILINAKPCNSYFLFSGYFGGASFDDVYDRRFRISCG
jgi:hypothetical protein